MLELLPESVREKFIPRSSTSIIAANQLDWASDTSSNGLLSPAGSPRFRRGHRRHLSLSRFQPRKAVCTVAAVALFIVFALLWLFVAGAHEPGNGKDLAPDGDSGIIPLGQSRYRDGREIFWWEYFPRLHGLYRGRRNIVSFSQYTPEQQSATSDPFDPGEHDHAHLVDIPSPLPSGLDQCYIDEDKKIRPPTVYAYQGLPQGMSAPLFGSQKELGLNEKVCYDRINRLAPYGLGVAEDQGGLGWKAFGDDDGMDNVRPIDWRDTKWHNAQNRCLAKNEDRIKSRTAFVIRTWHTFAYTEYHITMLRAIVSELALASGGQYTVHFLIQVKDDTLPIWASEEVYNQVLQDSLPEEFRGMGSLWSVAQMKLIYPPPFPDSLENFSGGEIYEEYRSLHFPLQYFASRHSEYDYFWQWEMDIRVTGHYHELLHQVTSWAERQPREYAWERSSKFYIPSLHDYSYDNFAEAVITETVDSGKEPVSGPQLPRSSLLDIPNQENPEGLDDITDLITFNPLFDPSGTRWAFHNDITGYGSNVSTRPPTRAALITASRLSRRLLVLMHEETYLNKRTMFPEMFPASIALHYGLKATYAPLPVYLDRHWPAVHADEVFNNAPLSETSKKAGMDHGQGHFHGENGSVFGPGEHVFRGASYYSNAPFAGYLWRRWLGKENDNDELDWESQGGYGGGRMCLPMMVLHPIKYE